MNTAIPTSRSGSVPTAGEREQPAGPAAGTVARTAVPPWYPRWWLEVALVTGRSRLWDKEGQDVWWQKGG